MAEKLPYVSLFALGQNLWSGKKATVLSHCYRNQWDNSYPGHKTETSGLSEEKISSPLTYNLE